MAFPAAFRLPFARGVALALALHAGAVLAAPTTYTGSLDDPANPALIGSGPAPSAPDFSDASTIANNVALYAFSLATAQTVEFRSLGFGEGGVDPYFTLFAGSDGTATVVGSNFDQAFTTGGDFDLAFVLAAGAYQFAIGAFANESFAENGGGTLADGFIGLGESFSLGDGHYRIEVTTSDVTTPPGTPVPEPETLALWSAAVVAWILARTFRIRDTGRFLSRTRRTGRPAVLVATMLASLGGVAMTTSASAQTRAALVQNTDEAGRNPYQSGVLKFCNGTNRCIVSYPVVPAGMRLVVTHISGVIATTNGSNLLGSLSLNADTPTSAGVSFTGSGFAPASPGYYVFVNQDCLAYFEPGDTPLIALDVSAAHDTFASASRFVLTGYYVKLP